MKKTIRWLLALGMAGALLGATAALAAGETAITVQLDGAPLSFTDAMPQVRDQRTFLPFRAVFEAMGAEVSSEGSVITAARNGKTLTMTLNEATATVTEGETTTPITMDVAPYVDSATWRTYVPVRFAAQAFGCAVGWDQARSTAIIVDTDKVVDNALEGKSFTYLEKLMDYSKKYNEGVWDMKADFDANMTMMAMPMTLNGSLEGTMQDSAKLSMDMNMKMDLSQLIKSVSLLTGEEVSLSAEDEAMLDALKNEGVDLSMRGDMGLGTLYMNMKGELMAAAGMNGEDWYKMDMAAMMEQMGMDWTQLMAAAKELDYTALVKQSLSTLSLTDSTAAYDTVKSTVEDVVAAVSDEGFLKEEDDYTAVLELEENGVTVTLVLTMTMKQDTVTAYVIGMAMEAQEEGMTVSMDMTTSMDDKDQMMAEMHMDAAGLMTMELTMSGSYAQGQTAPATEPPAGANVVDLMEMMAAEMGEEAALEAIGGADGPTAIFTISKG